MFRMKAVMAWVVQVDRGGRILSLDFLLSLRIFSPPSRTFLTWIETTSNLRSTKSPPLRRAGPPTSGRYCRQPQRNFPPPLRRRFPQRQAIATARRALNSGRRRGHPPHGRRRHRPRSRRRLSPRHRNYSTRRLRPTPLDLATVCRPGPRTRHPQCFPSDQRLSVRSGRAGGWR
jgi:hypothetical protein